MKIFRNSIFVLLVSISSVISLNAQNIVITSISTTPVTCGGGSDGTLTVTISGGIGPYSYLLSKGAIPAESAGPIAAQTFTFTGHDKFASYLVIVSDQSPAEAGISFASIDGPEPISITSAFSSDISCNNFNDGTIMVSAIGEGGNFIFDLVGPINETNETGSFAGLSQGDYTVTVSDKDGCPLTDVTNVLTINNPLPVSMSIDNITDVLCFGAYTGSISITPSGGTPSGAGTGYTYQWTGPNGFTSGAEDISSLEAGDYFITVYDGNMCSGALGPLTINQPTELAAVLNGTTDVTCNGGNDGTALISVSGGVGTYSFSWDGQVNGLISTDEDPVNLVADTYDLILSDANGCSKTFISFATIDEPLPYNITVDGTTDVQCEGGTDGAASITATGGTPPYNYLWTGAVSGYTSSDEDPLNMPADTYSLTISDSQGCSQLYAALLIITEPPPLILIVDGTTNVSCSGGNDGAVTITVSGGSPPYLFSWIGAGTGHTSSQEDPNDLVADDYTLIITDNNGCIQSYNNLLTIDEPQPLVVIVDNITDVNCNEAATGSVEITPSGGTPVYTFAWTGPNGFTASTEDISSLEAGDYSLTISDTKGCSQVYVNLATINENPAITATFVLTDISCYGGSDGAINTTISGGKPSYSYLWQGPLGFTATTKHISGLVPGPYTLTVTDNLACEQIMLPQTLVEPPPITATATHVDIDCFGAANGSINLTPLGGTPPYTFAWTGPSGFTSTLEDITGLEAGAYSVTVFDANSCSVPFTDLVSILEPAEILVSSVKTDISCGGLTDGTIEITVSGGTLPFTFAWTGPSGFTSSSEDIAGLAAGSYSLTITDGNGCTSILPNLETIIDPPPIVATYVSQQDVLCNGDASGSIEINVSGGTGLLIFIWTNSLGTLVSSVEDPTGLPAETYSLNIADQNGCLASYPNLAIINEPAPLTGSLLGTNIACYGDGDGTITVTALGGNAPYEYSIVGDIDPSYQPGNIFSSLGPGFYTIWTRDANLCVVTDTISILEPEEIQILVETQSGQNLCYGDSSVQISIDVVTGGIPPYAYSINGGLDFYPGNIFTNLPAGNYQTVVRDAAGCITSGNLNVITQPLQLEIDSYFQQDITSCYDALEGRIVILGTGGNGILTYSLNGTITNLTGDFQNLPGGPYLVSVADENGCSLDTSIVILTPPEIIVHNVSTTDVTGCFGDANGAVAVTGSGGTGTINYSLDGGPYQASGTFNGLAAGSYTITLKDVNDCTRDTSISIAEPAPITILSEIITQITCTGANDGTIEITSAGGTAPIKFTLAPGALSNETGVFSGLIAGIYTVAVNDAEGCGPVGSSPLTIIDPPFLLIDTIIEQDISCNGADDGSIEVHVSGGVPPYQYSVDNQANWDVDSVISGLIPGTYEVYVMDANLCVLYGGSYVMSDPPLLSATVVTTDIITCSGDTSGIIDVTGSGGTGNLEYSIDGIAFQVSGLFVNLAAGSYTVYLRDESGCSFTTPAIINEPDPVTATITKTDATYGNLGSISIGGVSGGAPPYEYSIEGDTGTFSTETVYTDLEAASYHVIVRDINLCTYEEMVDILDVLPLDVIVNVTHISCFGEVDGSIEFIPQNAEGAVSYSIDSGMNFISDPLFAYLPGNFTYYLVAIDEAGKVFTGTANISEPSELILSKSITPAECNVFSPTAAIDITVSGGSGPYSYLWSDGSTEEDRTNIVAGLYILETTDSNNCYRSDTMKVTGEVVVLAYAGEDTIICYGESIQLNALGGHTATWDSSPFITDPDIADPITLAITENTTFVVTITEEVSVYGCYNRDTINVTLFPVTGIDATEDTFIISGSSIQLEASGGPFIEYRWEPETGLDNSSIPNPIATPYESIRYYVYGTNEHECEESDSVYIDVIEDIKAFNAFSPNGDGINDYFEIEHSERFPEMLVEIYSRWGNLLYSTVGYDSGSWWDGTSNGKESPIATYYYIIIPYSGAKPITGNVTIIR